MSLIGDETNELLIQTLYPNRISSLLLFLAGYFPPWFLQAGEQDKKGWGERRLRFFHSPATAVYGPFFLPWDLHACLAASTGGFLSVMHVYRTFYQGSSCRCPTAYESSKGAIQRALDSTFGMSRVLCFMADVTPWSGDFFLCTLTLKGGV